MENSAGDLENKTTKKAPIVLAVVLGLLAAAYLGLCAYAMNSDMIFPNTRMEGTDIDLGGRTMEEAAVLLEDHHAALSEGTLTVRWEETGAEVTVPFEDVGFGYDSRWSAAMAYWTGGRENFLTSGAKYLRAVLAPDSVPAVQPFSNLDEQVFWPAARRLAEEQLGVVEPVDFTYTTDGADLVITKARDGLAVQEQPFSEALVALLRSSSSAAVTFTVDESLCAVLPAETGDLAALRDSLVGETVNAVYDHETGGITPSRAGASFTLDALETAYEAAAPGETFRFAANITAPQVTTEMLTECLFRDELSSYTTRVSGAQGRHENVRITAERINGYILNPGETMKYGPLVTPFTAENGYFPAPGYLQGKTVDMVGGGACQASSTLYAATLYANLEIVQRINHGFASDYIGLGLDATVAEGGPEFEFRNNTLYPIKVVAEFYTKNRNDYITVTLLGTKVDESYVKITTELLSTTPYEEEFVETDELAPGETTVEQTPYTGYDVKTYRNVYDGDGTLLSSTLEARSRYRARNRVTLVGKAVETPAPEVPELPAEPVLPADPYLPPAGPIVGEEPTPADPYVPPADVYVPPLEPETPVDVVSPADPAAPPAPAEEVPA